MFFRKLNFEDLAGDIIAKTHTVLDDVPPLADYVNYARHEALIL